MTLVHSKAKSKGFLASALILFLCLSGSLTLQAKGNPETEEASANPVTLFEIPDEVKVTFQICVNNEFSSPSTIDFQLNETVYLRLIADFYQGGNLPLIANNTIFVISDDTGAVIWNTSTCQFGGGWMLNAGGKHQHVTRWNPEKAGIYFAGVIFEETSYPNSFGNIMSFRVIDNSIQPEPDTAEEQSPPPESFADAPLTASFSASAVAVITSAILMFYFKKQSDLKLATN
jgi:hypothetical protein